MSELVLALDTATAQGGVALGRDGQVVAEVTIGETSRHAELLLPAIEFVLHAARADRSEISMIVAGAGPGSFTGVRIAAATARGMAAGLGVPLRAYSSLTALSAGCGRGDEPVCAMFDARRGEVYGGCYSFSDAGITTQLSPMAAHVDDVVHALEDLDVQFAGDGALQYAARLPRPPLPLALAHPRPAALLWLAQHYPDAGLVTHAAAYEPVYVRDSGAERGIQG